MAGEREPCAVRLGIGAGGVRLRDQSPVPYDRPVVPVRQHPDEAARATAGRAGPVGGGVRVRREAVEERPFREVHGGERTGSGTREGRSAPQLTGPTLPSAAPPSPRG
ncbi:hypothetical protein GCM10018791_32550 [Streptomyces zaomyceticus]|nr:hypothetical protein GCM10018791_32550 [Streptomyces zaomyceticus]